MNIPSIQTLKQDEWWIPKITSGETTDKTKRNKEEADDPRSQRVLSAFD